MKNRKLMRMLAVWASVFALAGCGMSNNTGTNGESETKDTYIENDITDPDKKDASGENDSKETSNGNDSNAAGSIDGNEIIATSDLQGNVIEFSDNGCVVNPVTDSEDGLTASVAAEGYEDEEAKVTITYGDNCIFQRAVMSIATGKATVSEIAKADIKKKTSLLLYGNFDDTENFTAEKVVIVQYEYEQGE